MNINDFSVLYVEDEQVIREKYINLFKIYFKSVFESSNGEDAIKIFDEKRPNLIVLDINLPIIDGLTVAEYIRKKDKTIKIIFLTAYSDKNKLLKAIDLQIYKYFIKPVKTFELEKCLQNILQELHSENRKDNILELDFGFYWDKDIERLYNKEGAPQKLTKNELLLLKLFCENKNKVFTKEEILNAIWDDFGEYNVNKLRILFSKLKSKLSHNLFNSIYNYGYTLKIKK